VTLDGESHLLTVADTLDTTGQVPIRLSWHLGPAVSVELDGPHAGLSWSVAGQLRRARLLLPGELQWSAHRGEEDPVLGWYSPGFGRRVPATSLVGAGTGSPGLRLVTSLAFE
jgi:hypothetical protein